jgi:hypothetical protein
MDPAIADAWIRARVDPVGPIETTHQEPWATVLRVPLAGGVAWFKACAPVQAFEPRLTAALFARWPDRVAEVLGWDQQRAWLLLADAGTPLGAVGNPPQAWLEALPRYAELQRGEAAHANEHLAHGVPDLRVATLPARYEELLRPDLPLTDEERGRLRGFTPRFAQLCGELAAHQVPETVQHDDLHMANVYARGGRLRVLDWGDASISHPFASLVVTFRFLEQRNLRLDPPARPPPRGGPARVRPGVPGGAPARPRHGRRWLRTSRLTWPWPGAGCRRHPSGRCRAGRRSPPRTSPSR